MYKTVAAKFLCYTLFNTKTYVIVNSELLIHTMMFASHYLSFHDSNSNLSSGNYKLNCTGKTP